MALDSPALALAAAVRDGSMSPVELAEAALTRIDRFNGQIGAFVRVFHRRARAEARAMERRRKDADLPVFFGVPTALKDTAPAAGGRTQGGSRAFKYGWTPFDGPVAKAVRAGGFSVLGKLATSELAVLPVTETDLHPPCRNPWNLEHTPGGSSGGSASAVAAGLLPIAHAEDGGGSIRIPAAFCHLYGHKPSRGLHRDFYARIDPVGLGMVNCVAQAVEDSAAMLDVLAGRRYDPRDPAADSLLAASRIPPRRLKVRFAISSSFAEVSPPIASAVTEMAARIAGLGHEVSEGTMPDLAIDDVLPVFSRMPAQVPIVREAWLQPATRWVRAIGRAVSAAEARAIGAATTARVREWMGDTDIFVTPTAPVTAPRIGAWRTLDGEAAFRAAIPIGAFTAIFNVAGQPAASLPAGLVDGLPFGVQLVGQTGRDGVVLALARQLEEAFPWSQRRPPLFAA